MKKQQDTTVLFDSPEAAHYQTGIQGWVSSKGIYFGNGPGSERIARYDGCTHVPCGQCGTPTPKGRTRCDACRRQAEIERYEAMPRAEWDGKALLYSEARDQYYSTPDDAAEDLEEDQTLADLRLVICEPNYVRQLEWDYCCDDLPEDGDVPDDVAEAMEAFNEVVAGIVLSWSPGKKALAVDGVRVGILIGDKVRIAWPGMREHGVTGTVNDFNPDTGWYFVELDSGPPWRGKYTALELEPVPAPDGGTEQERK